MSATVAFTTLGCRLNQADTQALQRVLETRGFRTVPLEARPDVVVVNTCTVTARAELSDKRAIRRAARLSRDGRVVVTGCWAQTSPAEVAALGGVDLVVGNADKARLPDLLAGLTRSSVPRVEVSNIAGARIEPLAAPVKSERARAFLKVQDGCQHRCAFCVVPLARGASRSLAPAAIEAHARALVDAGHAEIVLTGVDLTSYGADLPGTPKLGMLTKQILRHVPELKRLRISSIDQVEVDRDLLDLIADDDRLMPHLHLSLQSGDDLILKRMKRRHSRGQAVRFCAQVRRLRPDIALGADIIAGFPTESEEMFARSQDLVEACGLTFLHVFPYSSRPGTPAARMPQVSGEVIKERAKRLRATGEAALQKRLASEIGATRQVLIESAGQGRTEHFLPVAIADETPGAVRALVIAGNDGARLTV